MMVETAEAKISKMLSGLPMGAFRFLQQAGSSNDAARDWLACGAPDLALVYVENQTAGRGRGDRRWHAVPGASLTFSLVLLPSGEALYSPSLLSGLAAVAVCQALETLGLQPQIKWPNDILLDQRKACGILVEGFWEADRLLGTVLGIGINLRPAAVPHGKSVSFPATCIETCLGVEPEALTLLGDILRALLHWRPRIETEAFLKFWQSRLAWIGRQVEVRSDAAVIAAGCLQGLEADGSLRLLQDEGARRCVHAGELRLRLLV
jgi:BirA family biotin operon repressor/biotin-[acetyl-CoA-carboxylase] ligase